MLFLTVHNQRPTIPDELWILRNQGLPKVTDINDGDLAINVFDNIFSYRIGKSIISIAFSDLLNLFKRLIKDIDEGEAIIQAFNNIKSGNLIEVNDEHLPTDSGISVATILYIIEELKNYRKGKHKLVVGDNPILFKVKGVVSPMTTTDWQFEGIPLCYGSDGVSIIMPSITNRTANGFTVNIGDSGSIEYTAIGEYADESDSGSISWSS